MADDRYRLDAQLRYAWRHLDRLVPHIRRVVRNLVIGLGRRDHVAFYREVMRRNVAADPDLAVGSANRGRWTALGRAQFDYLTSHGLRRDHRLLEIGCGNLRGGRHFIDYLDVGNYTGIDISPDILLSAQRTLVEFGLQAKLPRLTLVGDLTLSWLPDASFDVVHAHSVFSHTPPQVIDECLTHVGRVMRPDGFFDFTFNETHEREHQVVREDWYYRAASLIRVAESAGFHARKLDDWHGNKQSKLRLERRRQA